MTSRKFIDIDLWGMTNGYLSEIRTVNNYENSYEDEHIEKDGLMT